MLKKGWVVLHVAVMSWFVGATLSGTHAASWDKSQARPESGMLHASAAQPVVSFRTRASDRKEIVEVVKAVSILADRVYTEAKKHHRNGTLPEHRASLVAQGRVQMRKVFTEELARRLERGWVDDQFENLKERSDQVGFGVTHVEIQQLTFAGNLAHLRAVVYKHLVDRVCQHGKLFFDRMEGRGDFQARLVRVQGAWKIAALEMRPDLEYTRHILTPSADTLCP